MFWTIFALLCVVLGLIGFIAGVSWYERSVISMFVGSIGALSLGLFLYLVGEWIVVAFLAIWPFFGSWLGIYWNELSSAVGDVDFGRTPGTTAGKERRARRTH